MEPSEISAAQLSILRDELDQIANLDPSIHKELMDDLAKRVPNSCKLVELGPHLGWCNMVMLRWNLEQKGCQAVTP